MNLDKDYIKFNEDCLDYSEHDINENIFLIKTIILELTYKYNIGNHIFINDLLRHIGGKEIPDGWNYGLTKGKSISPNELKIDYSGKYVKIFLKGFIPAKQIYDET